MSVMIKQEMISWVSHTRKIFNREVLHVDGASIEVGELDATGQDKNWRPLILMLFLKLQNNDLDKYMELSLFHVVTLAKIILIQVNGIEMKPVQIFVTFSITYDLYLC